MSADFSWERRVEFCETDAAGIVHFSSLVIYMEQAEHALLRSLGLSVAHSATSTSDDATWRNVSWPRVRVECDFLSPAKFEDIVSINVFLSVLGKKSVTYQHRLFIGTKAIATGSMTSVCCKRENGTLVGREIPAEIRDALSTYLKSE
ncbi:MAG: thioesterase family protein [Planctomycetota bacterium]|nr:thioesterase family protein [Planctomycetota bacterium]